MSEAHSKHPFVVETFTCYAGRAMDIKRRMDRDDADATKKPDGWDDGLHYYVRPVDPDRDPTPLRRTEAP